MAAATLLSALLVAAPLSASAATKAITVESKPVTMQFDGKNLGMPTGQVVFIYQSRVYIPLRFASYALQKQVTYDAKSKTVSVSEPTAAQKVALKEYLANAAVPAGQAQSASAKVQLNAASVKLFFDGVEKQLPTGQQVFNVGGTIYVPARFVSEAVGTTVLWDAATGTVKGESKAYRDAQQQAESGGAAGGNASAGNESEGGADGGSTAPSNGGSTGGGVSQTSYESITSSAYSQLDTLRTNCTNSMMSIALQYFAAATAERQEALKQKANDTLSSCRAQFESIMSDTEAKLKAGGYSTDVLQEYRATFEAELKAGKESLEAMQQ